MNAHFIVGAICRKRFVSLGHLSSDSITRWLDDICYSLEASHNWTLQILLDMLLKVFLVLKSWLNWVVGLRVYILQVGFQKLFDGDSK